MNQINIQQQIVIRTLLDLCSINEKLRDDAAAWVRSNYFEWTCKEAGLDHESVRKLVLDILRCENLAQRRSIVEDAISALTALS